MSSEVPSGWRVASIEDLTSVCTSGYWGEDEAQPGMIACRVIRNGDVRKDTRVEEDLPVRYFKQREIAKAGVRAGDVILVTSGAYTGNVARIRAEDASSPTIASNFVRLLREAPDGDGVFLGHLLASQIALRKFEGFKGGSAIPNLQSAVYRLTRFAVPPLPEQKKIAATLSSVDEAIQATQAVIEQTRRVKEGLLQDLLMRGIGRDGRPHTRFQQTEIGEIPEGWEVVNVDKVAHPARQTILTGPFGASLSNDDFVESGVPVLRIGNVRWGHLDTTDMLYVTEEKADELSKYRIKQGDLLFARQGATTGRNAMATDHVEGWLINYHIIRVSVDHSICLPEYLAYYFNSPFLQRQVDEEKGRGTREGVNSSTIRGFRFALPPINEQRSICSALGSADQEISGSESTMSGLMQIKAGLLQDLLSGKVRVSV